MNTKKVVDCNKRMFANSMCVKQTNTNKKLKKKCYHNTLDYHVGLHSIKSYWINQKLIHPAK